MKPSNIPNTISLSQQHRRNLFLLALAGFMSLALPGYAGDVIKADNGTALNLPAAWAGGAPPTSGDVAVWDSTVTVAYTLDLGASTNWGGIRLSGQGGAVTITNSTTTLTLGGSGIDISSTPYPLVFGCPLVAGAAQNWSLLPSLTVNNGLAGAAASGNDVTLSGGTLTIGSGGMTLSNLVVNSDAIVVPNIGTGIIALNGGMVYINQPSGVNSTEGIYVTAGGGIIRNNVSRQWYGALTGSTPVTVQVRGNFMRWGGNNQGYTGTINLTTWNGAGGLRIENVNAVSAGTAYNFSTAGDAYLTLNASGMASLGSISGGSLAADTTGYLSTEGNRLVIGGLNTDTVFSGNIQGTAAGGIIKSGTGRLTLDHPVVASTYAGFTTISNGVLQIGSGGASGMLGTGNVTNWSQLVFNISGGQTVANFITGPGNVTNIGSGKVNLTGAINYNGITTISGGILALGSASQLTNTIVVGNGGTLGAIPATAGATVTEGSVTFGSGCAYEFNFGTLPNPTSASVVSNTGTLNFSGNVTVNVLGTNISLTSGTITLLRYAGRSGSGSFVLGSLPANITATGPGLVDDTVNKELRLTINVPPPNDVTRIWVGDAAGNWDIGNTANKIWKVAGTGQATNFNNGVAVRFDDTATGTTNINLTAALSPSAVIVNNTNQNYLFGGLGRLTGPMGLTKQGTGTLITTNANDYSGTTEIDGGTLMVAGQGATLGSGPVTNYGTLALDLTRATALPYTLSFYGQISGTGNLTILGIDQTNSIVAINIADPVGGGVAGNPYTGGTTLSNVYVQLVPNPYDTVTASAAKSTGLGTNLITFLGNSTVEEPDWGTLTTSSYAGNFVAPMFVPAGQSATFKTAGRTTVSGAVTGAGTFNLGVSSIRGEIACNFGAFTGQINVFPSASGDEFRPGNAAGFPLAKLHLATGLTADSQAGSGSILRVGELSTEAGAVIGFGNNVTWQVGALNTDATNAANITSGNVSIIKEGTGRWTLAGTLNDYAGSTTISNGVLALATDTGLTNTPTISLSSPGVLDVSATTSKTFDLGAGTASQTLRGNGTIRGSLAVSNLGTVTPGFSIGTLTVTNTVSLGGAVIMELNRGGTPNSDRIVASSFVGGGILTVTNIGGGLEAGDSFQLFSTNVSGFATVNLQTNDPANFRVYTWTNRLAIDGTIAVLTSVQTLNPNPPVMGWSVSGNTLTLSWPTNAGWILQMQTNSLSAGLGASWVAVPNSQNVTTTNVTLDPLNGSVFFRMVHP